MFGFNRLSIIDVEHSHQPPGQYADGRYTIVFNGEIYNYLELREELAREHGATFATDGDTEAIVAAYHHWGPAAVAPAARHVRVPDLGRPGAGAVRRARPVRHQAAVLSRPGRRGVAFGSEKKSLLELRRARSACPTAPPAASTSPPCSTT